MDRRPSAARFPGAAVADPSARTRRPQECWMNRAVPALFAAVLVAPILHALPARAQFLDAGLDRFGFDQRIRQPALRLATLGRTTLAFEDENNEINQWDFGGSTVGLLDDRAGNSLDLFLDASGRDAEQEIGSITRQVERVDGSVFGVSGVARNPGTFAFGIDAGFQRLGSGLPRDTGFYEDDAVGLRDATVTATGRIFEKKVGWGARVAFGREEYDHRIKNQTVEDGELKLEGGDAREPASMFELVEGTGNSTRYGLGLGLLGSSWGDVSVNWDHNQLTVEGNQNTRRRVYEVEQKRGIDVWSLATTIRPLTGVTLGGVAGTGGYDTDETYRFSMSLGQGAPPALSRGTRYGIDAEGQFLRTRASIAPSDLPDLLLGLDFNVRYEKEEATVATGAESFNDFLDFAERNGFILGPPLENTIDELRHWDAGIGVGYRLSSTMRLGVEGHRSNDARDGTMIHARRRVTDLRGGFEADLGTEWQGRIGGWHRSLDEDVYTDNNEGVATALTLGAGWRPSGSKITLDGGIELLGRSTNYPDPFDGSGSGLRFVLNNRWAFD
jgi:hypothetical protein